MNNMYKEIIKWADQNGIPKSVVPRDEILLKDLKELTLSSYQLLSLPDNIGSLINLEDLWAGYNFLETIPTTFENLKKLKRLSLSNNKLTFLPEEITNLKELELLALDKNPLTLTEKQKKWLKSLKGNGCTISIEKKLIDLSDIQQFKPQENKHIVDTDHYTLDEKIEKFLAEISFIELSESIKSEGLNSHLDYLLNICVQYKNNKLIEVLLENRSLNASVCKIYFDKDAKYYDERRKYFYTTLLHYGIEEENINIVRSLLYNYNNLEIIDEHGRTPLDIALKHTNKEIVSLLTQHHVKLEEDKLQHHMENAIRNSHLSFVEYVTTTHVFPKQELESFSEQSFQDDSAECYQYFLDLLHISSDITNIMDAFNQNKVSILKLFLSTIGKSISIANYIQILKDYECGNGQFFATRFEHEESLKLLHIYITFGLDNGYFDTNTELFDESLLVYAVKNTKLCIVEYLLTQNSNHTNLVNTKHDLEYIINLLFEQKDMDISEKLYILSLTIQSRLYGSDNSSFSRQSVQNFITDIVENVTYLSFDDGYKILDEILFFVLTHTENIDDIFYKDFFEFINRYKLRKCMTFILTMNIEHDTIILEKPHINDLLSEAIRNNDIGNVKSLLDSGADIHINVQETGRNLPLIAIAIKNKNTEMTELLVKYGADANIALRWAYEKLSDEIRDDLYYEDLYDVDEYPQIEKRYEKLIQRLYQIGATMGDREANEALRRLVNSVDNPSLAQILLNCGADYMDYYNDTALYIAIKKGRYKTIKLFTQKKKEVESFWINSAFSEAIKTNKNTATVRLIYNVYKTYIDLDALPFEENGIPWGDPLILDAAKKNQTHMIDFMYENGAKIDATSIRSLFGRDIKNSNVTALMQAAYYGSYYCIKKLLAYGANINKIDTIDGNNYSGGHNSALSNAVSKGHLFTVQLLIDQGSNLHHIDDQSNSLLHLAAKEHHIDILTILLNTRELDINLQNNEGDTPLHVSIKGFGNAEEIASSLIKHGADFNILNTKGETPFILLTKHFNVNSNVIKMMIDSPYFNRSINDGYKILQNLIDHIDQTLEYRGMNMAMRGYDSIDNVLSIHEAKSIIDLLMNKGIIPTDQLTKKETDYVFKSADEILNA